MSKKKEKPAKDEQKTNKPTINITELTVNAIVDLFIGIILLLISKLIE